jgi:MFS transporter, DHA3 family, macrolide efflux protein
MGAPIYSSQKAANPVCFIFFWEASMKSNKSFLLVWAGQVVSILGSSLSWFALGVWIYQKTGSASQFALVALCTALPQMLVSPFAGVLIDRYNRRWVMVLADSGAALGTLLLAVLFLSGHIQVWNIYLITAASAACNALQAPAYSALVASIVQREKLGRANGMIQFGRGLAEILAPALAGWLVLTIKVPGILLIDLMTFCMAVVTLAVARIPQQVLVPQASSVVPDSERRWWADLRAGWDALRSQPGLVNLLQYQTLFSFLWSLFGVLVVPMILGFSDPKGLGLVLTLAGAGLLTGSLVLSAWGGPKHRLTGVLIFELVSALAFCLMGLRPVVWLVAAAAFIAHSTLAFVSSLSEAIWQSRVEKPIQGRVFGLKQTAVKAATLLAYLVAGGLADRVLEPLLSPDGALTGILGSWFGVGPGRGIAALFFLIGVVKALSVLGVYFSRGTRQLDKDLSLGH